MDAVCVLGLLVGILIVNSDAQTDGWNEAICVTGAPAKLTHIPIPTHFGKPIYRIFSRWEIGLPGCKNKLYGCLKSKSDSCVYTKPFQYYNVHSISLLLQFGPKPIF